MNSDSCFKIGNSHDICQDYALHGSIGDNFKFSIISDGCSASHEVTGQGDVGARIICFSAAISLTKLIGQMTGIPKNFLLENSRILAELVMGKSTELVSSMRVNPFSLDATLVVLLSDGKRVENIFYGDGAVALHKKNGEIVVYGISYPSGAPYYMNYIHNIARRDAYKAEFGCDINLTTVITNKDNNENNRNMYSKTSIDFDKYCVSVIPEDLIVDELDSISILSDGIMTYESLSNDGRMDPIPYIQVTKELAVFKSSGANFLKRRFNRFNKLVAIPGKWTHYDDVSIASIKF